MNVGKVIAEHIDWSEFTWSISTTCTCICGQRFRSHAKYHISPSGDGGCFSKDPCPVCNGHILQGVESDPDDWSLN